MIKWNLPTKQDPGFLKRRIEMMEILQLPPVQENLMKQAEYLSQYVETKKGISKVDQVLNASEEEINEAVLTIMGMKSNVEPKKEGSSVQL